MLHRLLLVARPALGLPCCRVGGRSRLDEHLQRLAVGHGAVAVWHLLQADGAIEHPAWFDPALEYVGKQLPNVDPGRSGAAGDGDVAQDQVGSERPFAVLGQADPADRPSAATCSSARARLRWAARPTISAGRCGHRPGRGCSPVPGASRSPAATHSGTLGRERPRASKGNDRQDAPACPTPRCPPHLLNRAGGLLDAWSGLVPPPEEVDNGRGRRPGTRGVPKGRRRDAQRRGYGRGRPVDHGELGLRRRVGLRPKRRIPEGTGHELPAGEAGSS